MPENPIVSSISRARSTACSAVMAAAPICVPGGSSPIAPPEATRLSPCMTADCPRSMFSDQLFAEA